MVEIWTNTLLMLNLIYYQQQQKMVLICEYLYIIIPIQNIEIICFFVRYNHLLKCVSRLLTEQPRKIKNHYLYRIKKKHC